MTCLISTCVALHPEGVDRNGMEFGQRVRRFWSPSTRRAWIEIIQFRQPSSNSVVALHPEGVDRNNGLEIKGIENDIVALHPEGVDRNATKQGKNLKYKPSPSTRRAWIEITPRACTGGTPTSPSTRRAWIEIINTNIFTNAKRSPSTRRAWIEIETPWEECDENDSRPPPGGRG